MPEGNQSRPGSELAEPRLSADAATLIELNRLSSRLWQMQDLQSGLEEMLTGAIQLLRADMATFNCWTSGARRS